MKFDVIALPLPALFSISNCILHKSRNKLRGSLSEGPRYDQAARREVCCPTAVYLLPSECLVCALTPAMRVLSALLYTVEKVPVIWM